MNFEIMPMIYVSMVQSWIADLKDSPEWSAKEDAFNALTSMEVLLDGEEVRRRLDSGSDSTMILSDLLLGWIDRLKTKAERQMKQDAFEVLDALGVLIDNEADRIIREQDYTD